MSEVSNPSAGLKSGRLAGKTAVITGGAAGMGRATSLAFAAEGATVVILDIQKDAGDEAVRLIREKGGTAEFIETDVSKANQVDAAFDRIADTVGSYLLSIPFLLLLIWIDRHPKTQQGSRIYGLAQRAEHAVRRRVFSGGH